MIRNYERNDFDTVVELMNEFGDYLTEIDRLGRHRRAAGFGEYFVGEMLTKAADKSGFVYVAETGGIVVGFIGGYVQHPSASDALQTRAEPSGRIGELYVTTSMRGRGIGRALIEKAEASFRAFDLKVVRVEVFEPNELAHRFYDVQGYSDRVIDMIKEL